MKAYFTGILTALTVLSFAIGWSSIAKNSEKDLLELELAHLD